jgi:flagellar biosynthesis protein FlhF
MTIKTFRARTLRDALAMVRAEFGPQAAVLHSREVNAGPIARLLRGRAVEVAATPDRSPLAEQAAKSGAALDFGMRIADCGLKERRASTPEHSAIRNPQSAITADPQLQVCTDLLAADVQPELARSLVREAAKRLSGVEVGGVEHFRRVVHSVMQESLAVTGPIRLSGGGRRVVALVGPTGVGKTTTLAKLAANYRLREGARVGLVTVDTYRTAAVDQLSTYAEIIDLPMEVVSTPDEMRQAVAKLAALDLVLIDTAGRSPRDVDRIEELRTLLDAAAPDETHLVTTVTSTARGMRDALERFAPVRPTSLLLTKLDEAPSLGHAAAPVVDSGLPVSYLTDGQSVPEDIQIAYAESLAVRLLGEVVA